MLIGVGLAIGFRANIWNIGAEGQLAMGAVFGGGIALYFNESTSGFVLPAMFIAGAVGGMLWASIPAFLKTRFNANEILVSLMLNYVAIYLVEWLIHGPWKGPTMRGFAYTDRFPPAALLPTIAGSRIHWPTLAIGLVASVVLFAVVNPIVAFIAWTLVNAPVAGVVAP